MEYLFEVVDTCISKKRRNILNSNLFKTWVQEVRKQTFSAFEMETYVCFDKRLLEHSFMAYVKKE